MNKPKILISFLNHRITDGRVFYREVRHLVNTFGDKIEVVAINLLRRKQSTLIEYNELDLACDGHMVHCYQICVPKQCSTIAKIKWKSRIGKETFNLVKKINPDLYFIADVREIPIAVKLHKRKSTPIIYDSHEDYVRQAIDYGNNILLKYLTAWLFDYYEKSKLRFFEAIFCTDEYLEKKYSLSVYKAKEVHLMRNFPYYDKSTGDIIRRFENNNLLKIVYIGGVDPYRGIRETANFVKRYNSESESRKLSFDIYGNDNAISKEVSDGEMVVSHDWIDHKELMEKLRTQFDVGVCLWQPIPKFFENLPIKNFDYMGVGLPIITSNFGNLQVHAERSKAGICIDPQSYDEFKNAVNALFDPKRREEFSKNGLRYVREDAAFQTEAKAFIQCIKRVLKV